MLELNINNVKFITTGNASGLSSRETMFHYFENENIITGKYCGGAIIEGQIVGKKVNGNRLELQFQCVTNEGELKSGQSKGLITKNEFGKLVLSFDWIWLNGDKTGGKSYYIEIEKSY